MVAVRRHSDPTERLRAVVVSDSARELAAFLDDPSPQVSAAAVKRLVEIDGRRSAAELRARLLDAEPPLVLEIAKALSRLGDGLAVDLALAGLGEQRYPRRLAATIALGALGAPRAVDPLRAALRDEIAGVRAAALTALGAIGLAADASADCAQLLADPDAHVRIAAVRAVARTARRPGTMLAPASQDVDRLVRLEVARHLAVLPEQAARALLYDTDLRIREAAAKAAGMRQVGLLAVLLVDDPSADVRKVAAQTPGSLGDPRIADVLTPGIADADAVVRAAVLRSLVHVVKRAGAMRRLSHELRSESSERRRAGVYALARLQAVELGEEVARLIDDPDPDVRLALIHTARALQPDPDAVVHRLAADPDGAVRASAGNWLARRRAADG